MTARSTSILVALAVGAAGYPVERAAVWNFG
jgi:hypothetical protein